MRDVLVLLSRCIAVANCVPASSIAAVAFSFQRKRIQSICAWSICVWVCMARHGRLMLHNKLWILDIFIQYSVCLHDEKNGTIIFGSIFIFYLNVIFHIFLIFWAAKQRRFCLHINFEWWRWMRDMHAAWTLASCHPTHAQMSRYRFHLWTIICCAMHQ